MSSNPFIWVTEGGDLSTAEWAACPTIRTSVLTYGALQMQTTYLLTLRQLVSAGCTR